MTTYEPGLYYGPKRHDGEVRLLLGEPAKQPGLFSDDHELPKVDWSYRVVWGEAKRVGQVFRCRATSFRVWGAPMADQGWWRRVDEGKVRHLPSLDLWFDLEADTVTQRGVACECAYREDITVAAEQLRRFLS